MIQVDYSKDDSIKQALAGVHVVISTIQPQAIDVQTKNRCGCQGSWRAVVLPFGVQPDIGKRDRGYLRRQGGYAGKVESDGCAVRRFLQWPVLGYGLDTVRLLIICYLLLLALVLPVQLLKPASTGSYNSMS